MTGTPLSAELCEKLDQLSVTELAFVAGYAWARSQQADGVAPVNRTAAPVSETAPRQVLLLSASQTGNARAVAKTLSQALQAEGIHATPTAVADYKAKKLAEEDIVVLISSTQGDGEPPEEAISFYKALFAKKAPKLAGVQFAVLALGDSSYPHFCQAGKDFDRQLEALGGQRLLDRVDCDLDYHSAAAQWVSEITIKIAALLPQQDFAASSAKVENLESAAFSKESPYPATLLTRQKITARGADKDVQHIELDLEGSGITYQPGDALGVWYENPPELVREILAQHQLSGDEGIRLRDGREMAIAQALKSELEITVTTRALLQPYAQFSQNSALQTVLNDAQALADFCAQTPPVALFHDYSHPLDGQTLVDLFRPLTPRLYSIASAQAEVADEVHLTVGVVHYRHHDQDYTGGASGFLGAQLPEDSEVRVFVEANPRFRLPAPEVPILMIGAGTGIAPYRAFMQQREAEEASGKNWLVFGNTRFTDDFLYQAEWLRWRELGLLNRADLAWSRQGMEKVYVQHKLQQAGAEVWAFLNRGAVIYVCGDAKRMAKDVERALLAIIAEHGGMDDSAAEDWLEILREDGRYQRDIY